MLKKNLRQNLSGVLGLIPRLNIKERDWLNEVRQGVDIRVHVINNVIINAAPYGEIAGIKLDTLPTNSVMGCTYKS